MPFPNLFLIGPMGAGKSTLGRRLAQLLNWEFVDSDQEIVERAGVSIPVIFDVEGEEGFRRREKMTIAELCKRQHIVLATGGGAVLDPGNRQCLREGGTVIYLQTSVDEQLRRVGQDKNRPLLQGSEPRERLEVLQEIREPLYQQIAHHVVSTDGCSVPRLAQAIIDRLPL